MGKFFKAHLILSLISATDSLKATTSLKFHSKDVWSAFWDTAWAVSLTSDYLTMLLRCRAHGDGRVVYVS